MAYRELTGPGPIYKFTKVGTKLEGEFVGIRPGKVFANGPSYLAYFRNVTATPPPEPGSGPEIAVSLSDQLHRKLELANPGDRLSIEFTGTQKGRQAQPFKTYKVFVIENDDPAAAVPTDLEAQLAAKVGQAVAEKTVAMLRSQFPDPVAFRAQLQKLIG